MKTLSLIIVSCWMIIDLSAQVVLNADGQTNTYDLINSVLAPGYDVVEVPDCGHPEFGPHIDQAYDDELGQYIFRFHIHKNEDSDRCINYDRQRTEIKSYDKSPDNLKAIQGERVEYKWKFKLQSDFAPSSSFTHLHQIKAVGGSEESIPLITLTARKGNPDKLELRYSEHLTQVTLTKVDLDAFKGQWVEVVEEILYGESGSYKIEIKTWPSGEVLLDYTTNAIRTWKTDADFLRPKWGIYRSLNDKDNLKDEIVGFANFSIHELQNTAIDQTQEERLVVFPNPAKDVINILNTRGKTLSILNQSGLLVYKEDDIKEDNLKINHLKNGMYFVTMVSKAGNYDTRKLVVY